MVILIFTGRSPEIHSSMDLGMTWRCDISLNLTVLGLLWSSIYFVQKKEELFSTHNPIMCLCKHYCLGKDYFFITTNDDASPTTLGHAICKYFHVLDCENNQFLKK